MRMLLFQQIGKTQKRDQLSHLLVVLLYQEIGKLQNVYITTRLSTLFTKHQAVKAKLRTLFTLVKFAFNDLFRSGY